RLAGACLQRGDVRALRLVPLLSFSSIGRHTRCYRDWSSDVCSSDLFRTLQDSQAAGDPDAILVKSYRDVAIDFLSKPEAKLQPVGGRSARGYRGLHERRTVTPGEQVNIGKEAVRIEDVEAGQVRADDML